MQAELKQISLKNSSNFHKYNKSLTGIKNENLIFLIRMVAYCLLIIKKFVIEKVINVIALKFFLL